MKLEDIKDEIPSKLFEVLKKDIEELRPSQEKAIKAGLFKDKNLIVCTPTASGKTLIAELAGLTHILEGKGKVIYIVPLKALATEKFKDFKKRYGGFVKIALSMGNLDRSDPYLDDYDLIITTSEKLDSLIRHEAAWVRSVSLVVVDEIHLLNDVSRGPTLEVLLIILRKLLKNVQILGLSATIGNPEELASWLNAKVVKDDWRPVELRKGVYLGGEIEFKEEKKK